MDKDNGSEAKWNYSLCSGTTSYWCIGCRAFYCMKGGPTERKCQNKSGRDPDYYEIDMIEEKKLIKQKLGNRFMVSSHATIKYMKRLTRGKYLVLQIN